MRRYILVILGNPPYNAFAGTSPLEEAGLVDLYKEGLNKTWGIKKFNLDDLYVRFFRIAERRIAQIGQGIVAYISNHSYVSEQSYVVARQKLLSEFDAIWIDSLNGDSRETGKKTPVGLPDPSVFSTKYNREGIRIGTAIGLFVRRQARSEKPTVKFSEFWGSNKRAELVASLASTDFEGRYTNATPEAYNRFSFQPRTVSASYRSWPTLEMLGIISPLNGLMEKRGGSLIDLDRSALEKRIQAYFDDDVTWDELKYSGNALTQDAARYEPEKTRKRLIHDEGFKSDRIIRYLVRPFDYRFCYYSSIRPLWNEPRPELWALSRIPNNSFLISRPAGVASPEGSPFYFANGIGDNDAFRGHAYYFPMRAQKDEGGLLGKTEFVNLSAGGRSYMLGLGIANIDTDAASSSAIWLHALAMGFSPAYLTEHQEGLAIDWPRIPLPNNSARLNTSAELGSRLADLLDPVSGVPGITEGTVAPHLKIMGVLSSTNLSVQANWGRLDKLGKVFPGRGKMVERPYSIAESEAIAKGAAASGMEKARTMELLGPALDIYLNDTACWTCVPTNVWNYFIGGYQVIKKWLSYREESIMGRPLNKDEAREVTAMVRRIASIVLMTDELNSNYVLARDNAFLWPGNAD